MAISIIAAIAANNAIGKEQRLLCHLPEDMRRFRELTTGHTVVMGRKTFESLPKGALPNRRNIVLTASRDVNRFAGCTVCASLDEALTIAEGDVEVFIIGGGAVYEQALKVADRLYITHIDHAFAEADTFFPKIEAAEWEERERQDFPADERHAYRYSFLTYTRKKR